MEETMTYQFTPMHLALARCACAIVATLALGSATAQSPPKEGNYDYISCWSGSSNDIAFSKTHGAGSFEFFVNNHTTPPGGMFDKTSARCVGLGAMLDGKRSGSSYCEATDKDGDKFMVRNLQEGPKATQEGIAGTGKYEGMVRTGISEPLGAFPPPAPGKFTGCARQTGTYKMK
jgi:hypothetical protein